MSIGGFIGKLGGTAVEAVGDVASGAVKTTAGVFRLMNGGDATPADDVSAIASNIAGTTTGTISSGMAQAGAEAGNAIQQGLGDLFTLAPLDTPVLGSTERKR